MSEPFRVTNFPLKCVETLRFCNNDKERKKVESLFYQGVAAQPPLPTYSPRGSLHGHPHLFSQGSHPHLLTLGWPPTLLYWGCTATPSFRLGGGHATTTFVLLQVAAATLTQASAWVTLCQEQFLILSLKLGYFRQRKRLMNTSTCDIFHSKLTAKSDKEVTRNILVIYRFELQRVVVWRYQCKQGGSLWGRGLGKV